MKRFEPVYKELDTLFIHKLPEYIEKINKEHNDGLILKPFQNTKLDGDCLNLPCFKFKIEESEYSEKDRIIESLIFTVSFEIKLQQNITEPVIVLWRYVESVKRLLFEEEYNAWIHAEIIKTQNQKIIIKLSI